MNEISKCMSSHKIAYFGIKRHPQSLRDLIMTKLSAIDAEIVTCLYEDTIDHQKTVMKDADAVLLAPARFIPVEVLNVVKQKCLLQIWSSGYDKFNINDAKKLKLVVANNGGNNSIAVAEQTMLLALSLMKKAAEGFKRVRSGEWEGNSHGMDQYLLYGKTIGIIGMGAIGSKVAYLASSFGMKVIYSDLERKLDSEYLSKATFCDMNILLKEADVISLHLHLNDQTRGIINKDNFTSIKKGAILINVSRAELVDRNALVDNLYNNHLGGLGLDVYYEEPNLSTDPLVKHPNFFGTPHSSCTYDTHVMALDACISNMKKYLSNNNVQFLI